MRVELYRHGNGFKPTGEEAVAVHRRMIDFEIAHFEVIRVRDPKSFRRHWKLMTLCAHNCERIQLDDGKVMPIRNKEDMHLAIKYLTGYCDYILDALTGQPLLAVPKSTSFAEMDEDEWRAYWPRVTDAVAQKVLPGVVEPVVELELLRCMGLAS